MELGVQRDVDDAQAPLGVGAEDVEPLARAVALPTERVAVRSSSSSSPPSSSSSAHSGRDMTCAMVSLTLGSLSAARPSRVERAAGMAARLFSGSPPCRLRCRATMALTAARPSALEPAAIGEVLGQGPGLVAGPGLEGGDELRLVDQADLQRDQAEEEVAVGDVGHGRGSGPVGRSVGDGQLARVPPASGPARASRRVSPILGGGMGRLPG